MTRTIRNPESFIPALEVADSLRVVAEQIQAGGGMVRYSIQFSFATEHEVEKALARKVKKSAGGA